MSKRPYLKNLHDWWPVYLVICMATLIVLVGIFGDSIAGRCASDLCNALRKLQWEALTAGLLGLAGGLAVIVAMQKQIQHSDLIAQQQRRDLLLSDINIQLADIEKVYIASNAFKARVLKLGDPTEPEEIGIAIVESLFSEEEDYDIRHIIELGETLLKSKRVPLSMTEEFCDVLEALKTVWGDIRTTEFGNIPHHAAELDLANIQMHQELVAYKKQILDYRLV